jgi:hypothetical protein
MVWATGDEIQATSLPVCFMSTEACLCFLFVVLPSIKKVVVAVFPENLHGIDKSE